MRQASSAESRCSANDHNLTRDTPELYEDARRRRHRGPAPPPSAVRPAGDDRAVALKSHAGYVTLSWEKTLNNGSWERTPTDGLDARKERHAVETAVDVYWWAEDDEEPNKATVRTHGRGTFLPSAYSDQLHKLMSIDADQLDVFGAYDVRKQEWTQTQLAQKIPPQRVLFLRSAGVRRTPGLHAKVAAAFPSIPRTPSANTTKASSEEGDPDQTPLPRRTQSLSSFPFATVGAHARDPSTQAFPATPSRTLASKWSRSTSTSPTKRNRSPSSPVSPTKRARADLHDASDLPDPFAASATPRRRMGISDLLCSSSRSPSPPSPPPSPTPSSTPSSSPVKAYSQPEASPDAEDLPAVKDYLKQVGLKFPMRYASDMILFFRAFDFMASQQEWIPEFRQQQGRFEYLLPNTKLVRKNPTCGMREYPPPGSPS
ncbi:hypothetical protein EV715DRAFT_268487 [Schizophyllum commune]